MAPPMVSQIVTLENYLSLYTKAAIGGIYTIFIICLIIVTGYLFYKITRALLKAIERHIDSKMQPRQIINAVKKVKDKIDKAFETKPSLVKKEPKVEKTK